MNCFGQESESTDVTKSV